MSFRGRTVCSLACATALKSAERKQALDRMDLNPVVCRCEGPPAPVEGHAVHCGECRRMFSVHVRMWLTTEGTSLSRLGRLRLKYEKTMRRVVEGRAGIHPAL
jgi:hypothetical protein